MAVERLACGMRFGTLSGLTLIRYSTTLWVYLGIRFFYCLAFIIGIMWLGVKLKQKNQPISTQPQKSRFVSLGIGWSPRKEERRKGMIAERREDKRTAWIASLAIILTVGIAAGYAIRDHQLVNNSYMFSGVSVISQQSDRRYNVHIPGYEKIWDWEFCHPLKMPSPVIDIKYEQRFGCKAVYGVGFVSIHEDKKNAGIQNGRNTAEAARMEARR